MYPYVPVCACVFMVNIDEFSDKKCPQVLKVIFCFTLDMLYTCARPEN